MPYTFIDLYEWPHDVNITLTILMRVLAYQSTLAEVLYLQMDNCCKENKNQFCSKSAIFLSRNINYTIHLLLRLRVGIRIIYIYIYIYIYIQYNLNNSNLPGQDKMFELSIHLNYRNIINM